MLSTFSPFPRSILKPFADALLILYIQAIGNLPTGEGFFLQFHTLSLVVDVVTNVYPVNCTFRAKFQLGLEVVFVFFVTNHVLLFLLKFCFLLDRVFRPGFIYVVVVIEPNCFQVYFEENIKLPLSK